jgi:hypothetical protein
MKMQEMLKKVKNGEITAEKFERAVNKRKDGIKSEQHGLVEKMGSKAEHNKDKFQ